MTHVTRTSAVADVADQTVVRSRTPTMAQHCDGHGYRTLPGASGGSVCSTWRQSSNGWNDVDNNNVDARRGRSDDRTAAELQSKLVFVDDDVDDVDRPNTTTNELRPSATPARLPCRCHSTGRLEQSSKVQRSIETALIALSVKNNDGVVESFLLLTAWLVNEKHISVYIDSTTANDAAVSGHSRFTELRDRLIVFTCDKEDLSDKVDLVFCLGGDSSLLYASSLFPKRVPPVLAFDAGCVGFLTTLDFRCFQETINHVVDGNELQLMSRSRLECVLARDDSSADDDVHFVVLNDVVVDRGLAAVLCVLDLYVDRHLVTTLQGDGLIISTPTGSTAYAASAGASMMHPSVPGTLIIPICPHTLSFRPIIVPAGVTITVQLSTNTRSEAWISFDGNRHTQLLRGDRLTIRTSTYPLPVVCCDHPVTDWFDSLAHCLHWNVRKPQKPLSPR